MIDDRAKKFSRCVCLYCTGFYVCLCLCQPQVCVISCKHCKECVRLSVRHNSGFRCEVDTSGLCGLKSPRDTVLTAANAECCPAAAVSKLLFKLFWKCHTRFEIVEDLNMVKIIPDTWNDAAFVVDLQWWSNYKHLQYNECTILKVLHQNKSPAV